MSSQNADSSSTPRIITESRSRFAENLCNAVYARKSFLTSALHCDSIIWYEWRWIHVNWISASKNVSKNSDKRLVCIGDLRLSLCSLSEQQKLENAFTTLFEFVAYVRILQFGIRQKLLLRTKENGHCVWHSAIRKAFEKFFLSWYYRRQLRWLRCEDCIELVNIAQPFHSEDNQHESRLNHMCSEKR